VPNDSVALTESTLEVGKTEDEKDSQIVMQQWYSVMQDLCHEIMSSNQVV